MNVLSHFAAIAVDKTTIETFRCIFREWIQIPIWRDFFKNGLRNKIIAQQIKIAQQSIRKED
jgi:hypothetical protein